MYAASEMEKSKIRCRWYDASKIWPTLCAQYDLVPNDTIRCGVAIYELNAAPAAVKSERCVESGGLRHRAICGGIPLSFGGGQFSEYSELLTEPLQAMLAQAMKHSVFS